MKKLVLASLLGGLTVLAQQPGGMRGGWGFGPDLPGRGPGMFGRTVTGAPFSAVRVSSFQQTLANGNTIQRQEQATIYRDSQGRTRVETTIQRPGGQPIQRAEITDPVAHMMLSLDMENHTVRQTPMMGGRGGFRGAPPAGSPGAGAGAPSVAPRAPGGRGARGGFGAPNQAVRANGPADPNTKIEDLGLRVVNGVSATGTRFTRTIPAGAMGNAQPLQTVRESWFSQDLSMVVMTSTSDPRTGTSVTQLTNIVRVEPDASLFQVPPGFTTVGGGRGPGGRPGMGGPARPPAAAPIL
jgi:hypothetical protein